jgi:hypothetical protein
LDLTFAGFGQIVPMALLILPFLGFIQAHDDLRAQKLQSPTEDIAIQTIPSPAPTQTVNYPVSGSVHDCDHEIGSPDGSQGGEDDSITSTTLEPADRNRALGDRTAVVDATAPKISTIMGQLPGSVALKPTTPRLYATHPSPVARVNTGLTIQSLQQRPHLVNLSLVYFLIELLMYLILGVFLSIEAYDYDSPPGHRPIIAIGRTAFGFTNALTARHVYSRMMALLYERHRQRCYSTGSQWAAPLQRAWLWCSVVVGELAWLGQAVLLVVAAGLWAWAKAEGGVVEESAFEELLYMALGQFLALCVSVGVAVAWS